MAKLLMKTMAFGSGLAGIVGSQVVSADVDSTVHASTQEASTQEKPIQFQATVVEDTPHIGETPSITQKVETPATDQGVETPATDQGVETPATDQEALNTTTSPVAVPLAIEEPLEKTSSQIQEKLTELAKEAKEETSAVEKPTEETAPKPAEKTSSHLNIDEKSDTLYTVNWTDVDGKKLKSEEVVAPSAVKDNENISGYDFVITKTDGDHITHIYQPKASDTDSVKTEAKTAQTTTPTAQTAETKPSETKPAETPQSDVAVYITNDSAKDAKYYYMESTARQHNSTNGQITRTTEENAKKQGFTWAGEAVEPNPQKTSFKTASQSNTASSNAQSNVQSQSDAKLPQTGDTSSGHTGAVLSSVGTLIASTSAGLVKLPRRKRP